MRALLAAALALAAGCYDPEVRDCTVTCSGPGDCASGQVCGDDGYCASAAAAGSCGEGGGAGVDAAVTSLRITITGKGRVTVATPPFACESSGMKECVVPVPAAASVTLTAQEQGRDFEGWSNGCSGQATSCNVIAASATTVVGARFADSSDGD